MSYEEMSESDSAENSAEPSEPEIPSMRGANEFEKNPDVSGTERHTSVEAPKEVWWRRFTIDLYENEKSAVRELVSNASTAVVRAEEMYDISNGVVEVTLKDDGDEKWFIIRDNGIGMSWAVIENVLSTIGETTAFNDGDKAGKWGMGFFAAWLICGVMGSFPMYTRPRDPERGYVEGWWVPGDFYEDSTITGGLEEDEYGTLFRIPLAETTDFSELRDGVFKFSEWSRVPIRFEWWQNGDLKQENEFGSKRLIDTYSEDEPVITVEHDEFTAHAAESASEKILLLDYITRGNLTHWGNDLPDDWNIDIRLKNENGVVVNCDCEDADHDGLMPVDDDQYESLPEHRRDECIRRAELTENDVTLPEPNASRDHVDVSDEFKDYLYAEFEEKYNSMMNEVMEEVDCREDFFNLEPHVRSLYAEEIFSGSESVIESNCEDWGYEINDELQDDILLLMDDLEVAKRNSDIKGRKLSDNQYTKDKIWEVLASVRNNEGEVFMGATLWQPRCDVIWDDNENNVILQVDSDNYDKFENEFGWRRVTEVKQKTIDEFDVSDEVASAFKSDSNRSSSTSPNAYLPPEKRTLKVHRSSYGKPRDYTVGDMAEKYAESVRNGEGSPFRFDTLVLYPSDANYNISENEWLIRSDVGAANCTKMVYEFLEEFPGVRHVNDYMEQGGEQPATLPSGEDTTIGSVLSEDTEGTVFHVLSEEWQEYLLNQPEEVMERFCDELVDTFLHMDDGAEASYAFVSADAAMLAEPLFYYSEENPILAGGATGAPDLNGTSNRTAKEAKAYLKARLTDWEGTDEFRAISDMVGSYLSEHLLNTIGLVTPLHDNGMEPSSAFLDADHTVEPSVHTADGKMPVSEAMDNPTPVFHVLDAKTVELFRDTELMPRFAEYIKENSGGYNDTDYSDSEITYIPITLARLKEVEAAISETLNVVYGDTSTRVGNNQSLNSDFSMYAYGRLDDWEGESYFDEIINSNHSLRGRGWYFIETLCQLHDMGLTPDEKALNPETEG